MNGKLFLCALVLASALASALACDNHNSVPTTVLVVVHGESGCVSAVMHGSVPAFGGKGCNTHERYISFYNNGQRRIVPIETSVCVENPTAAEEQALTSNRCR